MEKEANMSWQNMKLTTVCGADYLGKVKVQPAVSHPGGGDGKGKAKGAGKGSLGFGDALNHKVTVPILVNTKRLQENSVLLVYQAKEEKKNKKARTHTRHRGVHHAIANRTRHIRGGR